MGRIALVTGGSRGIGAAISVALKTKVTPSEQPMPVMMRPLPSSPPKLAFQHINGMLQSMRSARKALPK